MNGKKKILRKLLTWIWLISLSIIFLSIGIGYLWGKNLLLNKIGQERVYAAQLMSDNVELEVESITGHVMDKLNDMELLELLSAANSLYTGPEQDALNEIKRIDELWIAGRQEVIDRVLTNRGSILLREKFKTEEKIAEIFVTDILGATIAASGKTTDFYQADEEWWQQAYSNGNGRIYIGKIEVDESAGISALPVSFPVFDKTNNIAGICKVVFDITYLFDFMEKFHINESSYFLFIEDEVVVYSSGPECTEQKFLYINDCRVLKEKTSGWIVAAPEISGQLSLLAYAEPDPFDSVAVMSYNNKIVLLQPLEELLSPLHSLLIQPVFFITVLILIFIPLGRVIGNTIADPIAKLDTAVQKVSKGDLNAELEIRTGDELETLARAFNDMTQKLREQQVTINKTAKRMVQAEKMSGIGRLALGVGTKLNNPLAYINTNLSFLQRCLDKMRRVDSDDKENINELIRTMEQVIQESIEGAQSIGSIAGGLVGFTSIPEEMSVSVNVNHEIHQVIENLSKKYDSGIQVKLFLTEIPALNCQPLQLNSALTNIIENAYQAVKPDGTIEIRSYAAAEHAIVEISDNGCGIAENDLDRIFEPFFTSKSEEKTSGLGLSTANVIIRRHQGTIDVSSEIGRGTTVTVNIPYQKQ